VTLIVCGCTLVKYMRGFLPSCLQKDSNAQQSCYSRDNEIWSKEGREEVRQYIINQQDATLAVLCLLTTISTFYTFRTSFASIIRSTINSNSSRWCLSWVGLEKILYRCSRSVSTVLFHSHNVTFWPWNSTVLTDLDIYTGFIPSQLMSNTSGCCYSL